MSQLARGTRAAARPLNRRYHRLAQCPRRNASTESDPVPHGESAFHAESGATASEGFGKGFYVTLAAVPLAYVMYSVSSTSDNIVKRTYRNYQSQVEKTGRQDVLHAAALEQAISDRAALVRDGRTVTRDLRYPEMFNQGSPRNVVAGEGTADLRELNAFYAAQLKEVESQRQAKARAAGQ